MRIHSSGSTTKCSFNTGWFFFLSVGQCRSNAVFKLQITFFGIEIWLQLNLQQSIKSRSGERGKPLTSVCIEL